MGDVILSWSRKDGLLIRALQIYQKPPASTTAEQIPCVFLVVLNGFSNFYSIMHREFEFHPCISYFYRRADKALKNNLEEFQRESANRLLNQMCKLAKLFQSNGLLCENILHTMISSKNGITGAHRSYSPLADGNLYRETIVEGVNKHGDPIHMQSSLQLLTPSEAYTRAIADCFVGVGRGSYRPNHIHPIEDELYGSSDTIGRRLCGEISINIVVLNAYTSKEPALVKNVFHDITYNYSYHHSLPF